jgi:hypothetical protein
MLFMQQDEVRKIVSEQFYNSLAASGVQVSAIPSDQLRAVVDAMADSIFATLAAIEKEGDELMPKTIPASKTRPPTPDEPGTINPAGHTDEEVVLWRGRPYLTIGTRYELTTQRLRTYRGILSNNIEEIELIRIKDSKVKQHVGERMLNVGDVSVISADSSTPEFVLQNVRNPVEVRETIRKAVLDEKARRGLYYREDIGEEA